VRRENAVNLGTRIRLGNKAMTLQPFMRVAAILTLLYAGAFFHSENASAQVFDFGQIDAFETMGTGTQRGGSPPKRIVDDNERHVVFFTILESNTQAKIYWKSMNGEQTTIMGGRGVKVFQTAGQFRIEGLGDENHSFKYGYVLLRLKKIEEKI
jgi:hypothetical protein